MEIICFWSRALKRFGLLRQIVVMISDIWNMIMSCHLHNDLWVILLDELQVLAIECSIPIVSRTSFELCSWVYMESKKELSWRICLFELKFNPSHLILTFSHLILWVIFLIVIESIKSKYRQLWRNINSIVTTIHESVFIWLCQLWTWEKCVINKFQIFLLICFRRGLIVVEIVIVSKRRYQKSVWEIFLKCWSNQSYILLEHCLVSRPFACWVIANSVTNKVAWK